MKTPFSLLLVYGDGRVLRMSIPRWIAYGTLGLVGAAAASAIGLSGELAFLTAQSHQVTALRQHLDAQSALIDAFQTRVAAVRSELAGWKALHARMWEAFGPETGSETKGTGVGGAAPDALDAATPPGVKLRPAEELDLLASGVAEEGPRLRELEEVTSRVGKLLDALPLRWPLRGPVNSEFGLRRSPWTGRREQHPGIDIGSPPGTPVAAPAAGTVVAAASWGDFGRHVTIDHGHGVRSLYGHLREIDVKLGQKVEKGQILGRVGSTGRSTGPHLHYELLVEGSPVDPRGFLWDGATPGTP
jgi:murein DD-endopeptidase MepM/ murein hydrolase activator NlpD